MTHRNALGCEYPQDPAPNSSQLSESQVERFLQGLPKAELHLHLEGTIKPSTLVALSARHDNNPVSQVEAEAMYKYANFDEFLITWKFICQRLWHPNDYAMVARDMAASLATQGVKHAEVFVTIGGNRPFLDVDQIFFEMEAERIEAEKTYGLSILWIIDASRRYGVENVAKVFAETERLRSRYPSVVGVGIGGPEEIGPSKDFRKLYEEFGRKGLRLTAHCGESTGPTQGPREIRDAVSMGAERLGHAFCAQYDIELMKIIRNKGLTIDVSVTSNIRTGVCTDIQQHPLKRYVVEHGLKCTINSDDPAMFGSNLLEEYKLVHRELGFNFQDMKRFAEQSFRSSFLKPELQDVFIDMIQGYGQRGLASKRC